MMSPSNGHLDEDDRHIKDGTSEMMSMEMESLHPGSSAVGNSLHQKSPPLTTQLWMLIKLNIESYPKIFSTIGLIGLAFFMYVAVEWSKPPLQRHKATHDYSDIHLDYDFKASQIDHWCLFGGDSACRCEDFTEPISREESKGWVAQHKANKESIKLDYDYDIAFLGDDVVEDLVGTRYHIEMRDGPQIADEFKKNFTYDAGAPIDSVALGISGDSSSNLLWRMKHGEMPPEMYAKVWWISIGSNDLARGGCSEEATVLGILRVAEEVYFNNPRSVVVIQGILPRSSRRDGSLKSTTVRSPLFGKKHTDKHYAALAQKSQQLWPSIKAVNKELEDFCKKHDHIVYFDASKLFLGSLGNSVYHSKNEQIVTELMPDYVHLSAEGHQHLSKAILEEFNNIVLDEDEKNDIEDGNNRNLGEDKS